MSLRAACILSTVHTQHSTSARRVRRRAVLALFTSVFIAFPTLTQTLVGTISRPGLAPSGMAVYETGNKLCVFDDRANHLLIYDGATLALKKEIIFRNSISDPFSCIDMAVNEVEGKLYACLGHENWPEKWVMIAIVDLISDSLSIEIPIPGLLPQSASGIAYDPEIKKLFVAEYGHAVFIVDPNTNAVTTIDLPADGPHISMTLNPVTHEVFLANMWAPKLRIINGITHALTEEDAPMAMAMTLNWLENKVYFWTTANYPDGISFWIIDRKTGSKKKLPSPNDGWELTFNAGGNTVYTGSELSCQTAIFNGKTDEYFNLPTPDGDPALGFRYATRHTYFVGSHFIGVFDETTQMFVKIHFDNPHPISGDHQYVTVNQTTGRVFAANVSLYNPPEDNPIWVLQDQEPLLHPNVLVGGRSQVNVIDPEDNQAVDYWGQGSNTVQGIAYNPNGGRAYATGVGLYGSGGLSVHAGSGAWDDYGISIGNFDARVGSCDMYGQDPITPVLSPDGSKIYVTCAATNRVRMVDVTVDSNLFVINEIDVGKTPWGAALTPDGAQLYVANKGSNNVSVINAVSGTVTDSIQVGTAPWGLAINPSGMLAYVANSESGTVSVIDIGANNVLTNIQVGANPHWLSFTPDGRFAYVTNNDSGSVSVVDAGSYQVIRTISVGSHPEGICFYPDGSRVYVATDSGASIINTADLSVGSLRDKQKRPPHLSVAIANPTSRFAGRVTSGGVPLNGSIVRALQSGVEKGRATSNSTGDYSIFNLQSGTYDIDISTDGHASQSWPNQSVGRGQTTILHVGMVTHVDGAGEIPKEFRLRQNFPNPFNPSTTVGYALPHRSHVTLTVFNTLGQQVATLVNADIDAGYHSVLFDGSNLASGVYYYRLQAASFVETRKLLLIR